MNARVTEHKQQFRCIAKNSLGETDGTIRLYELEAATEDEEIDLRLPTKEDTSLRGGGDGGYIWQLPTVLRW